MADNDQQQPPPQEVAENPAQAYIGLNLESILRQIKPGQLSYALNAQVESIDGQSIAYQNEIANEFCSLVPPGYQICGRHPIVEQDRTVLFLANEETGGSEIGVVSSSCTYTTIVNQDCLDFSMSDPIMEIVHKITQCGTEVYWASKHPRRFVDIDNLPYTQILNPTISDPCATTFLATIDCNRLNVQPNFNIPQITYKEVADDGNIIEGSYQFAIQYTNYQGDPYTSYYSIGVAVEIKDLLKVGPDFNYPTSKSIKLSITNIDTTGIYDYFNLAVIKTINNITSVDLVGIYRIDAPSQDVLYTGASKAEIKLSIDDIFQKYVYFDRASGVCTVQDVLVWSGLSTNERISYQDIASQVKLWWQTWRVPPTSKGYADALNSATLKQYNRDEVYPLSLVILLTNGYQTDGFPLVSRAALVSDTLPVYNADVQQPEGVCTDPQPLERWQVYNTASVTGFSPEFAGNEDNACYEGPYQYGEFAYNQSTEGYQCNTKIWGALSGTPIRHFKFPDNSVSNHYDSSGNIYPIGVRIDPAQVWSLIQNSTLLTADQKAQIAGFKIVRGNRAGNKSITGKGLLFNVGAYTRDASTYYYPNYPYNDLRADPFIKTQPRAYSGQPITNDSNKVSSVGQTENTFYTDEISAGLIAIQGDGFKMIYHGIFTQGNATKQIRIYADDQLIFDSGLLTISKPNVIWSFELDAVLDGDGNLQVNTGFSTIIQPGDFLTSTNYSANITLDLTQPIVITLTATSVGNDAQDGDITSTGGSIIFTSTSVVTPAQTQLDGFSGDDSLQRFTFHSPDTSFYQPSLGSILKLETAEYGLSKGHFVEVKKHSKYKFPSFASFVTAIGVGVGVGFASATYGVSDQVFDGAAAFTAFAAFNDLVYKLIPRRNFAYQFNSVGVYNNSVPLPNDSGNKIRRIDIGQYLTSGINSAGDTYGINNYQREGSVYLKVNVPLPKPSDVAGVPVDNSRWTPGQNGCTTDYQTRNVSSFYAAIKRNAPDQYGQIGSYELIDTGFQWIFGKTNPSSPQSIFGGDTYISKFALKRKIPFFLDNRVEGDDDSDIFYNEIGNVGYPTYWFSTDVSQGSHSILGLNVGALFGVKAHNFDCNGNSFFYDSGKIYLFAYGIPYFYVETEVNVDYRQASNGKEGDFYPHISADVPDEWLQEINVSIANDNTYNYNKSFSKQNNENVFTTLPSNFIPGQMCTQQYPNKAIWSDVQQDPVYYKKNSWLIYKPDAYFDFPLNFGKLISLEGIENAEILARFENKMMAYNTMLRVDTSNPKAAYLGNDTLFRSGPPVDFATSDGGYAGTQHKFFLMCEFGNVVVDCKRGQIFLMPQNVNPYTRRRELKDLTGSEYFVTRFFTENLDFKILQAFSSYPVDNHYKGVGFHGVYDPKFNRLIITKLDYQVIAPLTYNATLDQFFDGTTQVILGDPKYFCNVSFTMSFDFDNNAWISFHSYLPNFYLPGTNHFYSGNNTLTTSIWRHSTSKTLFNNFYGEQAAYVIEYPFMYKMQDELLQNVKDYTKVLQYTDDLKAFIEVDGVYFNKAWLYNNQQNSGLIELIPKPKHDLSAQYRYPQYNSASKTIFVTKSNNFYNYNDFWDVYANKLSPAFSRSCTSLSEDKLLVQSNMDYSSRSFKKAPLRAKDLKIRHILDNTSNYKLISQFILAPSMLSYK